MQELTVLAAVGGFAAWFSALWLGIITLISRIGGWHQLSDKYWVRQEFTGKWKKFQYGTFKMSAYKGCLSIGCSANGLYIDTGPGPLFKFQHPALQIPWTAIRQACLEKKWGRRWVKLVIDDPGVTVRLPESALEGYLDRLPLNDRQ